MKKNPNRSDSMKTEFKKYIFMDIWKYAVQSKHQALY